MTGLQATSFDSDRRVAIWLLICCGMIFAMVVLGGVTRLTRSGLSIVEWEPIRGVLPPLTAKAWDAEFSRYKKYPEYKKRNRGMTLAEFKSIFWMEYLHRLWGRLIGLVFFLPFIFFAWRGFLTRRLVGHSLLIFVGGGLQGFMGWYMVQSGLVNDPSVSQYRLVVHLVLAFLLYAYILWLALGLLFPPLSSSGSNPRPNAPTLPEGASTSDLPGDASTSGLPKGASWLKLRWASAGLLVWIGIMVISGGFVAGLKAGLIFNTFPKMGPFWIPPQLFATEPWYLNFFERHATVQFTHRMLAYTLVLAVVGFGLWTRHLSAYRPFKLLRLAFFALLALQVSLGIAALLFYVPVSLGALHQTGALCLFTLALGMHFTVDRAAAYVSSEATHAPQKASESAV